MCVRLRVCVSAWVRVCFAWSFVILYCNLYYTHIKRYNTPYTLYRYSVLHKSTMCSPVCMAWFSIVSRHRMLYIYSLCLPLSNLSHFGKTENFLHHFRRHTKWRAVAIGFRWYALINEVVVISLLRSDATSHYEFRRCIDADGFVVAVSPWFYSIRGFFPHTFLACSKSKPNITECFQLAQMASNVSNVLIDHN